MNIKGFTNALVAIGLNITRIIGGVVLVLLIAVAFIFGLTLGGNGSPSKVADHAEHAEVTEWTCAMHPQIRQPRPGLCPICEMDLIPVKQDDSAGHLRRLTVSREAAALMNVQATPVQRQFVEKNIRLVGKVAFDETRMSAITAWIGGRLERLFVDYTGTTVRKGDHLVEIYSPELLVAQRELISNRRALDALSDDASDIVRRNVTTLYEAAREKLRLLGMTEQQIDDIAASDTPSDRLTIHAPGDGIVVRKHANEGDYVKTGERIYSIADLDRLWVMLDAFETDLAWLHFAQDISFTTESYPGEVFHGRIAFISPVLEDQQRTVNVRVNVENKDGRLKPGMFVRAMVSSKVASGGRVIEPELAGKWISPMHPEIIKDAPGTCDICGMALVPAEELGYVAAERESAPLVVPATSVLRTGERAVVYLQVDDDNRETNDDTDDTVTFEGREILLGPRAGDFFIVRHGLTEGDRVVTNGHFKIDSALQIRAKPSMMNPMGGSGPAGHDHGGHGKQQEAGSGNHADHQPAKHEQSKAPPALVGQWLAVARTKARLDRAMRSEELNVIQDAFDEVGQAVDHVDASSFEPAVAGVWRELAMQLGNDAAEGCFVKNMEQAHRAYSALNERMTMTRQRLALKGIPVNEQVVVSDTFMNDFHRVLNAYLAMTEAMSRDDGEQAMAHRSVFIDAARALRAQPISDETAEVILPELQAFSTSINALTKADNLPGVRKVLSSMTDSLVQLSRRVGDDQLGPVYRVHCFMALGPDRGADWLQTSKVIANPYLGEHMLRCGELREIVSLPAERNEAEDSRQHDSHTPAGGKHDHE